MKYSIALIILLTSVKSFGQFSKGDKVLSGTFSLNIQRAPDSPNDGLVNKASTFDFSPSFGLLLSENLEAGVLIQYSSSYYERNTITPLITEWKSNNISIGFYLQRYFKITDNFLFSIVGDINFGSGKTTDKTTNTITNEVTENETKRNSIRLNARPNFIFFPSNNWAIRASIGNIGYNYSKNRTDDENVNIFNINYGTIGLGVSYYFRQESK